MRLDDYCSAKQQDVIVNSLAKGDQLMADSYYHLCLDQIRGNNPDLKAQQNLQSKFSHDGLSQAELTAMEHKKESGDRQVRALDLELLHNIKSRQNENGLCTIDFDQVGNPYVPDVKITCKK